MINFSVVSKNCEAKSFRAIQNPETKIIYIFLASIQIAYIKPNYEIMFVEDMNIPDYYLNVLDLFVIAKKMNFHLQIAPGTRNSYDMDHAMKKHGFVRNGVFFSRDETWTDCCATRTIVVYYPDKNLIESQKLGLDKAIDFFDLLAVMRTTGAGLHV